MSLLSSTSDQNELKRTGCTLLPKKKKKKTETAVVKTLDVGAEMENKRGEHCDCTNLLPWERFQEVEQKNA